MSKPEWNEDTPKWANWLAQDADGSWWWYETKPIVREWIAEGWWHPLPGSGRVKAFEGSASGEWNETLEPRP